MQVMPLVAVTILDLNITFLNLAIRFLPYQVIDAIHHDVEVPHGSCLTLIDGDNGEVVAWNGHIERIAQFAIVLSLHELLVHPRKRVIIYLVPTTFGNTTLTCTCASLISTTKAIVALFRAVVPALVQIYVGILLSEILCIGCLCILLDGR